jgi:hypothetical protein
MPFQYPFIQNAEARAADQMAEAERNRLSAKTGRQHVTDDQTVRPSPEALRLATAVIRRGYILPETMEHPVVKSESVNLAFLIMAWGLAPTGAGNAGSFQTAPILSPPVPPRGEGVGGEGSGRTGRTMHPRRRDGRIGSDWRWQIWSWLGE